MKEGEGELIQKAKKQENGNWEIPEREHKNCFMSKATFKPKVKKFDLKNCFLKLSLPFNISQYSIMSQIKGDEADN